MVPANGNFATAIAEGYRAGATQGQTWQHARLINLLATSRSALYVLDGLRQVRGVCERDDELAGKWELHYGHCHGQPQGWSDPRPNLAAFTFDRVHRCQADLHWYMQEGLRQVRGVCEHEGEHAGKGWPEQVPGDGNFTTAIATGNHRAGVIPGQTCQASS